jgi:hypothetical protein
MWLRPNKKKYRSTVQRFVPTWDDLEHTGRCYNSAARAQSFDLSDSSLSPSPYYYRTRGKDVLHVQLLRVCKQIHYEAAPVLYGQPLIFSSTAPFVSFIGQLSPRLGPLLRSLEILYWRSTRADRRMNALGMELLAAKQAFNIQKLYLNCSVTHFTSAGWRQPKLANSIPKRLARRVYQECHPWLEAVGEHRMAEKAATLEARLVGVNILEVSEKDFEHYVNRDRASYETAVDAVELENGRDEYKLELRKLLRSHA